MRKELTLEEIIKIDNKIKDELVIAIEELDAILYEDHHGYTAVGNGYKAVEYGYEEEDYF